MTSDLTRRRVEQILTLRDNQCFPICTHPLRLDPNAHEFIALGDACRVYLGSFGAASNLAVLEKVGITHVLCVATDVVPFTFNQELRCNGQARFIFKRISVNDTAMDAAKLANNFELAIKFIEDALAVNSSTKVLVYCFMGRSRSVTIAAAFLIKLTGENVDKVLDWIRINRPLANPNSEFYRSLCLFRNKTERKRGEEAV